MQYRLSTIFLVFFVVATSLAAFGTWGFLAASSPLTVALLVYLYRRQKITVVEMIVILVLATFVTALLLPSVDKPQSYGHHHCYRNLKMIGMAMHDYHDSRGHFPSFIASDKNGKPLFSWLVTILPMMDRLDILDALNRDEPWDSPQNTKVLGKIRLREFTCPQTPREEDDFSANYIAIVGPGTVWRSDGVVKLGDLPNPSFTVMAVECVESNKHWAEPYTLTVEDALDRMKTGKGMRISTAHKGLVNVLFADGLVRCLSADMPISQWRKLLMGEIKSDEELDDWKANPGGAIPVNLWVNEPPPPLNKWAFRLSILVWLVSLALLFYRAWKSRPPEAEQNAVAGD